MWEKRTLWENAAHVLTPLNNCIDDNAHNVMSLFLSPLISQSFDNETYSPLQVPLIMRVPWLTASLGKRTAAIVELVDIYVTLCDLMDVPLPQHDTCPLH